LGARHE